MFPACTLVAKLTFQITRLNRLGASALMQGLADGYFVLPYTIGDFLADDIRTGPISTDLPEFDEAEKHASERIEKLIGNSGTKPVDYFS